MVISGKDLTQNSAIVGLVAFLVATIGFVFYIYYLRIKLRFSWFVFLDSYRGGSVQASEIFEKMQKLNIVAKGEGFKKALVLAVGTDSVRAISRSIVSVLAGSIGTISSAIPGMLGDAGKMIGGVTKIYGDELVKQATSYAEIVAMYTLYRVAREESHETLQDVNEYIYNL